jgi:hypothetical protein
MCTHCDPRTYYVCSGELTTSDRVGSFFRHSSSLTRHGPILGRKLAYKPRFPGTLTPWRRPCCSTERVKLKSWSPLLIPSEAERLWCSRPGKGAKWFSVTGSVSQTKRRSQRGRSSPGAIFIVRARVAREDNLSRRRGERGGIDVLAAHHFSARSRTAWLRSF